MATVKLPSKLDLGDYLPYLVNRVGTIIAEQFGAETLAPHHLSIVMWRVMAVLATNGDQRQIDLADLTSIDASTLSRIVTRLVRLGFVTRTRSASSNREVVVALSAKGGALVARLIPLARAIEIDASTGLYSGRTGRAQTLSAPHVQQYEKSAGGDSRTAAKTRRGLTSGAFPHRRPDRSLSPPNLMFAFGMTWKWTSG